MVPKTARGTTPTFSFDIDLDLTGWDVYVTIKQSNKREFTFNDAEIVSTSSGCAVILELTQEQTLAFIPGKAYVQVRAVLEQGGEDPIAVKTNLMEIWVDDVLFDEKIPQEG